MYMYLCILQWYMHTQQLSISASWKDSSASMQVQINKIEGYDRLHITAET